MARECLPGLHLIQECGPDRTGFAESRNRHPEDWYEAGRAVHVQNAYLLRGGEANLLLDTLSPPPISLSMSEQVDEDRRGGRRGAPPRGRAGLRWTSRTTARPGKSGQT